MPEGYFHGLKHVFDDTGTRPIVTQSDESIFIACEAPNADAAKFPVGETTLISSSNDTALIAGLGNGDDAPKFIDGIFDQVDARVFLHRLPEGADEAETISNTIGGVDVDTEKRHGLQAAFDVKQRFGIDPSIFIAPGVSQHQAVATEMASVSKKLAAVFALDGPNGKIQDAITYRGNFDEPHGMLIDPHVSVWDTDADQEVIEPCSARVAGIIAATPWWQSVSSRKMYGINGLAKDIDYRGGDGTSRAELLNQNHAATVVRHPKGGYKLLGGRGLGTDPKFVFFKRARVMNVFARTILDQMQWAVDRNMTRRYFESVVDSMNKWIRHEVALEHIAGGRCWVNEKLNTPESMESGAAYFDYDFVEYGEAERITFTAHINNGYLANILPV
ncbi:MULTISPECIES: phage tail sheath subtilisin-like domain-containing protein [unclassified Phaeobacter]|uniref:phage tail sheath subtilisin-like domain-containing protein n=1 Tax=unclassified Phaeobacter TaxID=2621772 RepID=UPI003A854819